MRIPTRKARTLSGLNVTIPTDFTGDRNALLIAFDRSHLLFFPAWRAALREALAADPALGYYAVALVGDVPRWHQRLLAWAIRLEISDSFARDHIALMLEEPEQWGAKLGITDFDAPLLVICDREGTIHATADGPPRAVTTQAVARALLM
ncbi:MAG: hypothetical protein AAFV45_01555 [Pseudomonadota bacterium]